MAMGALTIDGHVVLNGERVLIKDQSAVACGGGSSNGCQNGVYTQTTLGDAGTAFVLTRATDSNTPGVGAALLGTGNYYFVTAGTNNASSSWIITTANPITIGTTDVTFAQFSASPSYSTNSTLTLTGTVFGINAPVLVATGGTGAVTLTGLLQGNGTGAVTGISNSSTTGQVLRVTGGSTYAWGALNLANSSAITGNLLTANLPTLTSTQLWVGNGSNVATAVAMSGDITMTNAGVTAIGASKVTNSMILNGTIAATKLVGTDIATVGTITTGIWNAGAVTSSGAVTGTQFTPTGGSATNGLYLAAANNPAIASNSKRRVSVDSSGNVNIVGDGSAGGNLQFGGFVAEFELSSYCSIDANSFNGVTDMAACIQGAINAANTAASISTGGYNSAGFPTSGPSARVRLPCGALRVSTIELKSFVELAGSGKGCTVLLASSVGLSTATNTQSVFMSVHDLTVVQSGCAGCAGLQLYSAQHGTFYNLELFGFNTGYGIVAGPTNPTPTEYYTNNPFGQNGNFIFNYFDNIFLSDNLNGIYISGQYNAGSTCIGGVAIDATDNYFSRITIWNSANGVIIDRCADSNHWLAMQIYPKTNGSCFFIGNDGNPAQPPVNADTYQQEIDMLCGAQNGTGLTMIAHNGNSFGHHVKVTTDELRAISPGPSNFAACVGGGATTISFASLDVPTICDGRYPADIAGGYSGSIKIFSNVIGGYIGTNNLGAPGAFPFCYDNTTISPIPILTSCTSDRRVKENIVTLGAGAMDKVKNIDGVNYNFIKGDTSKRAHFIAQDVMGVIPECAYVTPDKMPDGSDKYGVDDGCMIAYLWQAVKELEAKVK